MIKNIMNKFIFFIVVIFCYSFAITYTYTYEKDKSNGGLIGFEKNDKRLIRKFYYDKNGILQKEEFFKGTRLINYKTYIYNNNRVTKEEYYGSSTNKLIFNCTYRYNENNQLEKKTVIYPKSISYKVSRDGSAGNAIGKGKLSHFYLYKYDNNNLIAEKVERKNQKVIFRYIYSYGENSLKVEKKNSMGSLIRTFEYEFDKSRRLTKAMIIRVK